MVGLRTCRATLVGISLTDGTRAWAIATLVHRTLRLVLAARHPVFWSRQPTAALRKMPADDDERRDNSDQARTPTQHVCQHDGNAMTMSNERASAV
jgi:hypothetical protein